MTGPTSPLMCLPAIARHPTADRPCSCVPGPLTPEAGLIYAQGVLLVARTLLTDHISWLEGRAGRWSIQRDVPRLLRVMAAFVGVSIPAAVVTAGLKYMQARRWQCCCCRCCVNLTADSTLRPAAAPPLPFHQPQNRIKLAFIRRLTHRLHGIYTSHRAYYAASTLGGAPLLLLWGWFAVGWPSMPVCILRPSTHAHAASCCCSLLPLRQASRTRTSGSPKMWSALRTRSASCTGGWVGGGDGAVGRAEAALPLIRLPALQPA